MHTERRQLAWRNVDSNVSIGGGVTDEFLDKVLQRVLGALHMRIAMDRGRNFVVVMTTRFVHHEREGLENRMQPQ